MTRKPSPHRRTFVYARVSSIQQTEGTSLQDQQAACAAYVERRGMKVTKAFVEAESGERAKEERREQMRTLLREIRAGDLVVCDKLDRWSRDREFTLRTIREILEKGASFYAVADACDPSTREGDLMLGLRAVLAHEDRQRIRERMVGTRERLVDAGYYAAGQTCVGYRRRAPKGVRTQDKNVLEIEPEGAARVRRIFSMCIAGTSMAKIAKALDCNRDLVFDTLRNRVYLGELRNSEGQWIRGRHEPIITAAVFAKAQAAFTARRHGGARPRGAPARTDDWVLRDVATCGRCGARMSAAYAGSQPDGTYSRLYYKCSHKCMSSTDSKKRKANRGNFVPVRPVEQAATPYINGRLVVLHRLLAEPPKEIDVTPPKSLEQRRATLIAKRERTVELYTDGVIDKAAMTRKVADIDAGLLQLEAEKPAPSPLADDATRKALFANIKTIINAWKTATPQRRRAIINLLAEQALIGKDRPNQVTFRWRAAEDLAVADIAAALSDR